MGRIFLGPTVVAITPTTSLSYAQRTVDINVVYKYGDHTGSGSRTTTIKNVIKQISTANTDNLVQQTVEFCAQQRLKATKLREPRDLTDIQRSAMASKLIAEEELSRAGE